MVSFLLTMFHPMTHYNRVKGDVKGDVGSKTLSKKKVERQEHNHFRFWGEIKELEGRFLRVITLEDKKTIHNAFLDRRFKP